MTWEDILKVDKVEKSLAAIASGVAVGIIAAYGVVKVVKSNAKKEIAKKLLERASGDPQFAQTLNTARSENEKYSTSRIDNTNLREIIKLIGEEEITNILEVHALPNAPDLSQLRIDNLPKAPDFHDNMQSAPNLDVLSLPDAPDVDNMKRDKVFRTFHRPDKPFRETEKVIGGRR